jgi:hypothetical protein
MSDRDDIRIGMLVRDAEGKRLGRVVSCEETFFEVERRGFFLRDPRLSYADIGQVIDQEIHLQSEERWKREPEAGLYPDEAHPQG